VLEKFNFSENISEKLNFSENNKIIGSEKLNFSENIGDVIWRQKKRNWNSSNPMVLLKLVRQKKMRNIFKFLRNWYYFYIN